MRLGIFCFLTAVLLLTFDGPASNAASVPAADIVGAAVVLDDASLRIRTKVIRLYGIYIPFNGRNCSFFLRPPRCGNRAAVSLETKIQGFVHCHTVSFNADRSVNAICFVRRTFYSVGEDLAAYLLAHGLALASPGASFEYVNLERIAQTRQLGLWGFQVDAITPR